MRTFREKERAAPDDLLSVKDKKDHDQSALPLFTETMLIEANLKEETRRD